MSDIKAIHYEDEDTPPKIGDLETYWWGSSNDIRPKPSVFRKVWKILATPFPPYRMHGNNWWNNRVLRPLDAAYMWLAYRTSPNHRYHVLRLGKPGWRDTDKRMEEAVIALFRQYVERELGFHPITGAVRLHGGGDRETVELYDRWLKSEREVELMDRAYADREYDRDDSKKGLLKFTANESQDKWMEWHEGWEVRRSEMIEEMWRTRGTMWT